MPYAEVLVGSYAQLKVWALPSVAFVHGYTGSFEFLFDSVNVILLTRGKRGRVPDEWQLATARTTHASIGGVTDFVDQGFLWSCNTTRAENAEVCVPKCLARDVYLVVSDTVSGRPCPKPVSARLIPPTVLEVSPGLYHSGGLLPADHTSGAFVVCSIFTATKWCRRRLTKAKLAMAFDISKPIIQECSASELALVTRHPSWALEHCAKTMMGQEGVIDRRRSIFLRQFLLRRRKGRKGRKFAKEVKKGKKKGTKSRPRRRAKVLLSV
jgi:hypothetical protein